MQYEVHTIPCEVFTAKVHRESSQDLKPNFLFVGNSERINFATFDLFLSFPLFFLPWGNKLINLERETFYKTTGLDSSKKQKQGYILLK